MNDYYIPQPVRSAPFKRADLFTTEYRPHREYPLQPNLTEAQIAEARALVDAVYPPEAYGATYIDGVIYLGCSD